MRELTRNLVFWAAAVPASLRKGPACARKLAGVRWPNVREFCRPVRAARRDIPRRLQTFTNAFVERSGRTELEFVALARSLRCLYTTATALAGLVNDRMGSIRSALDESRITGSDGMAAVALKDLRDGLAEASQELNALRSVAAELRRLRTQVESIERVGVFVRSSVVGFAVESVRSADCQQTFGSFVGELRALANKITGVAEDIGAHAGDTQKAQELEVRALSGSHEQLCHLAKELEATAITTADEAQALLDGSLSALQQAEARMRQITRHADEAVYYLQFGDIVRQKSEHIAAALQAAAEQLARPASRRTFGAQAVAMDRVLAIQIGQLELVRAEIESARQKLGESFRCLAEESGQLRDTLRHWQEQSQDARSGTDPIDAFKADLESLGNLHRQGHDLHLGARRAAQNAIQASRQLTGHVEQVKAINSEIHLQALNAIVKTAALGEQGVTLSVLSMHVEWLYRESRSIVSEIVTILEAILRQAHAASASQDLTEDSGWEARLHAGMGRIESAYDACRQTSVAANKLVGEQQGALDESSVLLDFLGHHVPAIAQQIEELESLRRMLAPWSEVETAAPAATAESLSHNYTMQSERDIHLRAGQGLADLAVPAGETAAADNLEFFAPPAPPDVKMVLVGQSTTTATQNDNAPSAPAAPEPAGSALGDNVELF